MSIGVFDSGVGGLTVHRMLVERMPAADFVYLADQANAPYGGRPGEEIAGHQIGPWRRCLRRARTSSFWPATPPRPPLRTLQQTWLPDLRKTLGRPVNILGIIVPTIEAATGVPWSQQHAAAALPAARRETVGVFDARHHGV